MPKLSKKGQDLPSSPIRKLVVHADEAKSRGIEVLHLNIGQPDIQAPKEAMEIVKDHDFNLLPYGSSQGSLSYRAQLCQYYQHHDISIKPDDIIVTTGASEALSFTLNVICDAGDEVIIPEPFYANYNGFAAASSVEVVPVVSHFENQFELPPIEKLKENINDKTRAIMICNPSNPTGYLYTEEEVKSLIDLAVENDIFIIVDEVYREFIYTEKPHYSVLKSEKASQYAVMIDSVSKRYSLCGARVGCMISKNKALTFSFDFKKKFFVFHNGTNLVFSLNKIFFKAISFCLISENLSILGLVYRILFIQLNHSKNNLYLYY